MNRKVMDAQYNLGIGVDVSKGIGNAIDLRKSRVSAIEKLQKIRNTRIFVLWTLEELQRKDFYTLADMLEEESPKCDIDLLLLSHGGNGEAGYRIAHTFQGWAERNNVSFNVIVPLYAMSAATIVCMGAHNIVMGISSELGPIDPQVSKYDRNRGNTVFVPALALLDGLKLVSEYIDKIPAMSTFFEEIVRNEGLTLVDLGLLERMRETGKQQAEALLAKGMLPEDDARSTSERLTDYYKYHGYPIDLYEAEEDLSLRVSHSEGEEWSAIKQIRNEFQRFVGRPGIIPGTVVTCAIETAQLRSWRYTTLNQGQRVTRAVQEHIGWVPTNLQD